MGAKKRPPKVLIVDDEDNIRKLMSYIFDDVGFITEEAKNGKEALQKVAQSKPDIIILDVAMPELDGIQACIRLRGNPDTRNIPIIFLSAQVCFAEIIKKLPGATIEFIDKPCDIECLLKRVNSLTAEQEAP